MNGPRSIAAGPAAVDLRVAAYAVITDDRDRILLSRWIGGAVPRWTMPGGGMDPGEPPEAACVREVREETGYEVVVGDVLGVDSTIIDAARRLTGDRDMQALRIVYRATVVGGTLMHEIDGSTDMAAWIPRADVGTLERLSLVDVAMRFAGLTGPVR